MPGSFPSGLVLLAGYPNDMHPFAWQQQRAGVSFFLRTHGRARTPGSRKSLSETITSPLTLPLPYSPIVTDSHKGLWRRLMGTLHIRVLLAGRIEE